MDHDVRASHHGEGVAAGSAGSAAGSAGAGVGGTGGPGGPGGMHIPGHGGPHVPGKGNHITLNYFYDYIFEHIHFEHAASKTKRYTRKCNFGKFCRIWHWWCRSNWSFRSHANGCR